ncbi:MAG: HD domain-containing protein [Lachnospiraceae bacterium]|nr:HD domain-containing protein [Lachnospiraceae bacterium]
MKNVKIDRFSLERALSVLGGVVINVILAFITQKLGLPLAFDTVGTMIVAFIGGAFPGVLTALFSTFIFSFFNEIAPYYLLINVLLAICASYIAKNNSFKSPRSITILIIQTAVISGIVGSLMQWLILGQPQHSVVADTVEAVYLSTGIHRFILFVLFSFLLNIVDKGLSVLIALLAIRFTPEERRIHIYNSGWHQKPLTGKEIDFINDNTDPTKHSLQKRIFAIVILIILLMMFILGYVAISVYLDTYKTDKVKSIENIVEFASEVIDPDKVEVYLKGGRDAFGYLETENMLYNIKDRLSDIDHLYVVKIIEDGYQVIFDLNTGDETIREPGDFIQFEEKIYPYIDRLAAGKEIETIETKDSSGWVMTVYKPLYDNDRNCVCYICADTSFSYMSEYMRQFITRVILIMSGIIIVIIIFIMREANFYLVYPVRSITSLANRFVKNIDVDDDIKKLNKDVGEFKKMNIRTEDEVQNLYNVLCTLTGNVTEQLWEIQHYSDAVSKMQNGLIITMADMVENRDSDTGAHIQKTAEYVRIIANGLKKKGYYAEKITPKYIEDIVMSAPLHDVGKINISDKILNKPGKLTEEEYEIMKTHTTAGRIIMEKAISTVSGENYLKEARNMAAYHHEKWDGTGYPDGLHGEVIPLSARIMAVADVFDAVSSKRVYKPAMPLEKALAIIEEGSGNHFDPKCVEVFMDSLDDVKRVLRKYREYEGEI